MKQEHCTIAQQGVLRSNGLAQLMGFHLQRMAGIRHVMRAIEKNMQERLTQETRQPFDEDQESMKTNIHVVSNRHISAMLGAYAREYVAHKGRVFTELHAKVLGETLLAANMECVESLLGEENTPRQQFELAGHEFYNPPEAVEALKLCACLEMHCSLAPSWPGSDAKRELDHMRAWFIEALSGYQAAKWEI